MDKTWKEVGRNTRTCIPMKPQTWGVSTSRGKNIYLHVLKPVKEIILPDLSGEIAGIRSMIDDTEIRFVSNGKEVKIKLPEFKKDVIDYVLELSRKYISG